MDIKFNFCSWIAVTQTKLSNTRRSGSEAFHQVMEMEANA